MGCGVTTPISSQCPVVVSLPLERSARRPATAGAPGCGGHPSSSSTLPSPSASRLGTSSPPTARATFPRVSEPSSPKRSASGSAPAPTPSSTMTHALDTGLFYEGHVHRSRPVRHRPVHHRHDLGGRRDHLRRRQGDPGEGDRRGLSEEVLEPQTGESGSTSSSGSYSRACASATAAYVMLPWRTLTPRARAGSRATASERPWSATSSM